MKSSEHNRKELEKREVEALLAGGQDKIDKQHKEGKLTARERLDLLFDAGTFIELDRFVTHRCYDFEMDKRKFYGDGVVTGYGKIEGRLAYAFSQDFTVFGGALGMAFAEKICKVMDLAMKTGAPFIGLNDSGGARIQEGVESLAGYAYIFLRNVLASGVIPQISAIMGPCAGGAVYSPAMTDFIIMTHRTSYLHITGPDVIRAALGKTETPDGRPITSELLGGAKVHMEKSGVAHFAGENDEDAIRITKRLLSFLPQSNTADPPRSAETEALEFAPDPLLDEAIPDNPRAPYNVLNVIVRLLDGGDFFEVQARYAANIVVGFGRIGGRSVGIIANQPSVLAGALDINSSDKASRFILFCDAMNIPLVTLVDVPGFLPGIEQEHGGIIRHGAKMLYAYGAATVPKITIILRKAYGGAFLAMCGKAMGADRVFAWPTAEIAVMGAEGAVRILYKKELEQTADSEALRIEKLEEYRRRHASPYIAAGNGQVDAVIMPRDTREYLLFALETLHTKRELRPAKKHGTMPL